MPIDLSDVSVSLKPPSGHYEPYPLLLESAAPTDQRIVMVSAYGTEPAGVMQGLKMVPAMADNGFSTVDALDPTYESQGVFRRSLVAGDVDGFVAWPKPAGWSHFVWASMTVRGALAPTGGRIYTVAHVAGSGVATVPSINVPGAGLMVLCVATLADPGGSLVPNWAAALGVPTGWQLMEATDNSGLGFFSKNSDPGAIVVAKWFTGAGVTGAIGIPVATGLPAFVCMWVFLQPALPVSVNVVAA